MIKRRHTKPYESKMRSNKAECSTSAGPYCMTHDAKVTFCMPYFSSVKIALHRFNVDKNGSDLGIGYEMIIGRESMAQLGLPVNFNHQVLKWDSVTAPMKEPTGLIGQTDITSHEMCEVETQTTEPVSTREATERLVKILENIYANANL